MALTERSRSALYTGLSNLIQDEEAVGEMLSYFPARDAEEPATKEFVRAEVVSAANRVIVWAIGLNVAMCGIVLTIVGLAG